MNQQLFAIDARTPTLALHARLVSAGFTRTLDTVDGYQRLIEWQGPSQDLVFYISSAVTGANLVVVRGQSPDSVAALADRLRRDLAFEPLEALIGRVARLAQSDRIDETADLILAIGQLRAMGALLPAPEPRVIAQLTGLASDPRRAVRIAVIEAIDSLPWRELDATFAPLLEAEPAFAAYGLLREQARAEREAGTFGDYETDDREVLIDRAKLGLRDGKPARVRRAAEMLLADDGTGHHGYGYRGFAAKHEGRLLAAYLDFLVARERADEGSEYRAYWANAASDVAAALRANPAVPSLSDLEQLTALHEALLSNYYSLTISVVLPELQAVLPAPHPLVTFVAGLNAHARGEYATAQRLLRIARDAYPTSLSTAWAYRHATLKPREDYPVTYGDYGPNDPSDVRALTAQERAESERALEVVEARIGMSRSTAPDAQLVDRFYADRYQRWTNRSSLAWLARVAYDAGQYDRVLALCERLLADEAHDHAWHSATMFKAQALTGLRRHDEAIDAYATAVQTVVALKQSGEVMWATDPRGQMHFNRACELCKVGRRDEALRDLKLALTYAHDWIDKARADDYFTTLWKDPRFTGLLANPPPVRDDDEPEIGDSADDVALAATRLLAHIFRGEYRDATLLGTALLRRIEDDENDPLRVRVLTQLGTALAYSGDTDAGLARSQEAVVLAKLVHADEPSARVEPIHMLGAVHHVRGEHAEARARYEEALALRMAAEGPDTISHSQSFGDLARLASNQGDLPQAIAWTDRGRALLQAALQRIPSDHDDWFEALFNLATIDSNLAMTLAPGPRFADAVDAYERSVDGFCAFAAAGRRVPEVYIERSRERIRPLLDAVADADEQLHERARAAWDRLESLHPDNDDPPVVRSEKIFWRALGFALRTEIAAHGKTEPEAGALLRAMMNHASTVPSSLQPFVPELARRVSRGGFLVTSAMAISLLESGASTLEATIRELSAIGVGYAMEEAETG